MKFFQSAIFLLLVFSLGSAFTSAPSAPAASSPTPAASAQSPQPASAQPNPAQPNADWKFVVSGDSRNCGNVIMPSIAEGAIKNQAAFYLHLGDLRAINGIDEDYQHEPEHRGKPADKAAYLKEAWDDFIQNQIGAFGSVPFFFGIGNQETIKPKSREEFAETFAKWLDAPPLKKQRLTDDPKDTTPKTYYHWIQGGVDFISLDNASLDEFSSDQMSWAEGVIQRAAANPEVHSLVVG